jgi:hypothetical protein
MTLQGISQIWFAPVISTFVKQRTETLFLAGAGLVQVGLVYAHLPGWPCPFKAAFGIPCPGCGLSTACSLLLHGQWQESFKVHAFAPFFLAGLGLVIFGCLLPDKSRQWFVERLQSVERRTGLTAWFLVSLFLYWGLRLLHLI